MSTTIDRQKNKTKKKGWLIIAVIVIVAVLATLIWGNTGKPSTPTSIITYNVEEVTFGNVSATISGSGALTQVSSKTFKPKLSSNRFSQDTYVKVKKIKVAVGQTVKKGKVLLKVTHENGVKQNIKAPYAGVIVAIPVTVGKKVYSGEELITVMSKKGFNITLDVDELDITSVKLDQEVKVAIDAAAGAYTGKVANISYLGTSNGSVTTYQVTIKIDYSEDLYPGMNADSEIIVNDSGEGLLVPLEALRFSGEETYILLADAGAVMGSEYQESEIDISKLRKVVVKTGMSDGTYIMVESSELKVNDLIMVPRLSSTATASDYYNSRNTNQGFTNGSFIIGEPGERGQRNRPDDQDRPRDDSNSQR